MEFKLIKFIQRFGFACFVPFILSGCGEVQVYDVDTKFSQIIQVEPVSELQKTVFIRVKDVTGYASEVASSVEAKIKALGYRIVTDPADATFKLLITVVKFGAGSAQDQITFMQAVDPKAAAELAAEQVKVRHVQRSTNVYEKKNPGLFSSNFGERKSDVYGDDVTYEKTSIRTFADRVGIIDIDVLANSGRDLKSRVMVGVNMRGGLFVAPTESVNQWGWTRLIERLSLAISGAF